MEYRALVINDDRIHFSDLVKGKCVALCFSTGREHMK